MHIRNAPVEKMKELGYHEGYKYPHDYPGHYVEQQYLPDKMLGTKYYEEWFLGRAPWFLGRAPWSFFLYIPKSFLNKNLKNGKPTRKVGFLVLGNKVTVEIK